MEKGNVSGGHIQIGRWRKLGTGQHTMRINQSEKSMKKQNGNISLDNTIK